MREDFKMTKESSKKKPDMLEIASQINKGETVFYDQKEKEKYKLAPTFWKKLKVCFRLGK